mgnify:CR=1 FL=1
MERTVPPACSIFLLACSETLRPATVMAFRTSPAPRTFPGTRICVELEFFSRENRFTVNVLLLGLFRALAAAFQRGVLLCYKFSINSLSKGFLSRIFIGIFRAHCFKCMQGAGFEPAKALSHRISQSFREIITQVFSFLKEKGYLSPAPLTVSRAFPEKLSWLSLHTVLLCFFL